MPFYHEASEWPNQVLQVFTPSRTFCFVSQTKSRGGSDDLKGLTRLGTIASRLSLRLSRVCIVNPRNPGFLCSSFGSGYAPSSTDQAASRYQSYRQDIKHGAVHLSHLVTHPSALVARWPLRGMVCYSFAVACLAVLTHRNLRRGVQGRQKGHNTCLDQQQWRSFQWPCSESQDIPLRADSRLRARLTG